MNKHHLLFVSPFLVYSFLIIPMEKKSQPRIMTLEKIVSNAKEGFSNLIDALDEGEAKLIRGINGHVEKIEKTITYVCNGPRTNRLSLKNCLTYSSPSIPCLPIAKQEQAPIAVPQESEKITPNPNDIVRAFIARNPNGLATFIAICDQQKVEIDVELRQQAETIIAARSILHDSPPAQ